MLNNEQRMEMAERRIQQLQDAGLDFYAWSGHVGNRLTGLEAGFGQLLGQVAIVQKDMAVLKDDVSDLKRDMKQVHRFMIKIAQHLDVDLDDDTGTGE